jgi:hypothetical protein
MPEVTAMLVLASWIIILFAALVLVFAMCMVVAGWVAFKQVSELLEEDE